ncbi:MAG: cell wall-binding repeat-containing protein, partial [Actinomycetes bacterium]
ISRATPWTGTAVFLASGSKFPDALSAGPVAAAEDAHLLLSTRDAVPAAVQTRLQELSPSEVVLVGDQNSISSTASQQIRAILPEVVITRIAGADRLQTSLRLLDRMRETTPIQSVWVVAGGKFPDALVAGSIAGRDSGAILLDWHHADASATDAWASTAATYVAGVPVYIAGSEASVSSSSAEALRRHGAASVQRFAGSNRYETARAVHDAFSSSVPSGRMLLATGENFPDALGGSLLAATMEEPLYLAPSRCHSGIAAMLRAERDQRGITAILGLGGTPSLSERALRLLDCPPPPPAPSPTPTPSPQPSPPAGPPPAESVNCDDFPSWSAAQAWFLYWFPIYGDIAGLDGDDDGIACESLR